MDDPLSAELQRAHDLLDSVIVEAGKACVTRDTVESLAIMGELVTSICAAGAMAAAEAIENRRTKERAN